MPICGHPTADMMMMILIELFSYLVRNTRLPTNNQKRYQNLQTISKNVTRKMKQLNFKLLVVFV